MFIIILCRPVHDRTPCVSLCINNYNILHFKSLFYSSGDVPSYNTRTFTRTTSSDPRNATLLQKCKLYSEQGVT